MQPEPQSTPTPFNVPLQSKEVKGKKYNRHSPNRDPRTPYNDILINIRKRVFPMPANYGSLVQNYTLRHFEGSVETPSTPSIPSNHTDVTIISQTTFLPFLLITPSPERLFFFPYLLARWGG